MEIFEKSPHVTVESKISGFEDFQQNFDYKLQLLTQIYDLRKSGLHIWIIMPGSL